MMKDVTERVKVGRKDTIEWLLKTILKLPKVWLIISSIFVLLSMFNVAWTPQKGISFAFQVTSTTAVFFALIWLPALLGIFALVGGGVKTPAGEITSSGITTLIQSLESDTLGVIIEDTAARGTSQNATEVNQIQQEVRKAYVARISDRDAREELLNLAERYNKLRKEMPSGSERTIQMRSLSGRMRALAPVAKLSPYEITAYLQSSDEGKRLVGLAAIRISEGKANQFEQVLQIIGNSQSAYEQFQSLSIMLEMVTMLNKTQKDRLVEMLNKQRDYDEQKKQWIRPHSDRRKLSDEILFAILNSE